ncbi:class I adenylate-forming enzyme family protein [Azospirillum agricola]|uniref:class I adenylate-forming enzyme family protein n=1 Tax=Azospirillum agricola TaxID=1720247 RepID=UPI001B3B9CE1|nr:AMP-binding protein [Azospirillum agricola]
MPLLQDFLIHAARTWPTAGALTCGKRRLTYAALCERACRLAWALRQRGVERGDRVVIFAENGVEAVTAFWGGLLAGAVVVPVNPQTKTDKLGWLLDDCGAAALVADDRLVPVFAPAADRCPSLKTVLATGNPIFDAALEVAPGNEDGVAVPPRQGLDIDLAALVYTSGSRGEPKGVMLSHRNMLTAAASIGQYLGLTGNDVLLCALPLAFDYGLYQMILSARHGARLVLERGVSLPAELMKRIAAERVTVLPVVPTIAALLAQLRDRSPWDLSSVRTVTNTAAALPAKHISTLQFLFPKARIFSMYGLTECKRCTYLPPEDLARKPGSVGIAIPNTELWLIGDDGERLGPGPGLGQTGQLVIRGATVMQGYWNKPEETARKLHPGPLPGERVLHTGDLCRLDEEGYLYFVGRMDDIIKSRGEKVAPVEVEAALLAIPGVREAAVIGVPDPLLGEAVKAFVVADDGADLDEATLRRACAERLESVMVPRRIKLVPALPRTDSGKIRKVGLA